MVFRNVNASWPDKGKYPNNSFHLKDRTKYISSNCTWVFWETYLDIQVMIKWWQNIILQYIKLDM